MEFYFRLCSEGSKIVRLFENIQLCSIVLNFDQLCLIMFNCVQQFSTVFNCIHLCSSVFDFVRLFSTVSNFVSFVRRSFTILGQFRGWTVSYFWSRRSGKVLSFHIFSECCTYLPARFLVKSVLLCVGPCPWLVGFKKNVYTRDKKLLLLLRHAELTH